MLKSYIEPLKINQWKPRTILQFVYSICPYIWIIALKSSCICLLRWIWETTWRLTGKFLLKTVWASQPRKGNGTHFWPMGPGWGKMSSGELGERVFLQNPKRNLRIWNRGTFCGLWREQSRMWWLALWQPSWNHKRTSWVQHSRKRVCAKIAKPLPNPGVPCLQIVFKNIVNNKHKPPFTKNSIITAKSILTDTQINKKETAQQKIG